MVGTLLALLALPAGAEPEPMTVFAAASLADAMQEIGAAYRAGTGVATRFSFAASSALARQIASGAPADAFVSADVEWMDYLAARGLIDRGSRRSVAGNELVLIAPADSTVELAVAPGLALRAALGNGRLAIADPESVPAGRYAKAALAALGAWRDVEPRLAPAENVRAALALVSRGEAPLGIVYRTDARIDPKVKVVGAFPEESHPPISYPAARVTGGADAAAAFIRFLCGDTAQAIFLKYGFTAPPPRPQPPAPAGTR
jgi:molybdate transport system substrate-binding protein